MLCARWITLIATRCTFDMAHPTLPSLCACQIALVVALCSLGHPSRYPLVTWCVLDRCCYGDAVIVSSATQNVPWGHCISGPLLRWSCWGHGEGRAGGACMNHSRCSFRFLSYKDLWWSLYDPVESPSVTILWNSPRDLVTRSCGVPGEIL